MRRTEPHNGIFNALPAAVLGLAVVIFGLECLFSLADRGILGDGSIGLRITALKNYAFFGQVVGWMIENHSLRPDFLLRFVTYPLISAGFTQAVFVCVFILALGKMVGEALGNVAVLAIFFLSSIFGALIYGLILSDAYPLVGGFPGAYGLVGSFTFLAWVRQRAMGQSQMQAFRLILMLIGIQLIFAVSFGGQRDWVADAAGAVAGFLLSFLFVPGGIARLREMIRRR